MFFNYRVINGKNIMKETSDDLSCYFKHIKSLLKVRGRPFDAEGGGGGGGGWHFLEINILTLKILEINNLSYSGKKINNLT